VTVPQERAEEARAVMIDLFPEGFEEVEIAGGIQLTAYTNAGGEERIWHIFGAASSSDVPGGWEERWREFHRPVRVGELWIGPPWEKPPDGLVTVVVDPGQAFGTGGHATTRLCLALLAELPRGSLLDVGCGSGVLAIAAAKLGFAPVVAVDVDPAAIEATVENAAANDVVIDTRLGDALADRLPSADVAVANIALGTIEGLAPRLDCRLLVVSGYLEHEQPAFEGFRHVLRRTENGWAADVFESERE
jgi:ribosomal protein L11 methyltransferase